MTDSETRNSQRKQRIVKNADISIHDVFDPPGANFNNWTRITKQKLIEREQKVTNRRLSIVENIINEELQLFQTNIIAKHGLNINLNCQKYTSMVQKKSLLFERCIQKISEFVNAWTGVSIAHMTHKLTTFRQYFLLGKSWFDQRKKKVLAIELWIPVLDIISRISTDIAQNSQKSVSKSVQSIFQRSVYWKICVQLFSAKISSPSSRPHALLANTLLLKSMEFRMYVSNHVINIEQWGNATKKSDLMHRVREKLKVTSTEAYTKLENTIVAYANSIKASNINSNSHSHSNINNITLHTEGIVTDLNPTQKVPICLRPQIPKIHQRNLIRSYNGSRGSTFNVCRERHVPYGYGYGYGYGRRLQNCKNAFAD